MEQHLSFACNNWRTSGRGPTASAPVKAMVLALLALLAVVPAGMMPGMREPDLTVEDLEGLTAPEPDPATN